MEHILENPLFIDEISISGIIRIKGYDGSGTDTSYAAKKARTLKVMQSPNYLTLFLDSQYSWLKHHNSIVYLSTFFVNAINEVSYIYYIGIYLKLMDRLF